MAFALASGPLTACTPLAPGSAAPPASPADSEETGSASDSGASGAAGAAGPGKSAPPAPAARLFSQEEVEALAGSVAGPGGEIGDVLTGGDLWDVSQSFHFGAGAAEVSPSGCADVLAWAMLMSDGLPAAGTFSGTRAEPVHLVVSADRGDVLALAFPTIFKLPDCSPVSLTVVDGTATANYRRASAFTDADGTYAVLASIGADGADPGHFLRVAAKTGTLFVQAIVRVADPDDYRAAADRLTGYVNQVVAAQKRVEQGLDPLPPAGAEFDA
ncbi:hypothetical protein [Arthrobacter sp. EPSL27]|uniref:hypothetical protein n=1 Tax=Arthrobacter sp. EPSL27 TaxID=1745378 RepID=UPI00074B260D|nr:hypothetical protein [Arthrobacter sp. EPSL27]KUM33512.1 hypothetical protein AR539_16475 [Arthrobacter sp. EPSL27]